MLEPTLMVIGINFRTAPVGVRERFWIAPEKRREALTSLYESEGIEEVIVLASCKRTEFLLWASDATVAANSVLRLLSSHYHLQLCEWEHFYRLLGEDALAHVFRVASGLDSMISGDPEAANHLKNAWNEAQAAACSARCLNAVLAKAFEVSEKLRQQGIEHPGVSIASVAVETAKDILDTLEGRRIVLIGAGRMAELAAAFLANQGATSVRILNRTYEHALQLAQKVGGTAVPFEDLPQEVAQADLVIGCSACGQPFLSLEQVKLIVDERKGKLLCVVDLGLPRNVDPAARDIDGIFLYDLDDVRETIRNSSKCNFEAPQADKIVADEARDFQLALAREHITPLIVPLRERLDRLCKAELHAFRAERGPFPREQDRLLVELTFRITQCLASVLARELKEVPEKAEQQHLAETVSRLFHLEAEQELAG